MSSDPGARDGEGAVARPDGRDRANIASTFARCFRNAIAIPSPITMDELKDATRCFAEAMRDDGARPERALVQLKALLRDPGDEHWTPSWGVPEGRIRVESRVYHRLFRWWLAEHFATPPSRFLTLTTPTTATCRQVLSGSLPTWNRQATADSR